MRISLLGRSACVAPDFAHAVCDGAASCCTSSGFTFNATSCVATATATVQQYVSAAACGGSTYDATAAAKCFSALQAYSSGCENDPDLMRAATAACNVAFKGAKQPGEPCTSALDCAQPAQGTATCLHWSEGNASGVECQSHPVAHAGDACAIFGHDPVAPTCDAGLFCDQTSNTCTVQKAVGAPCTQQHECVDTAVCVGGNCVTIAAVGDPCTDPAECPARASCDPTSSTCVAMGLAGDVCATNPDCASLSCPSGKCAPANAIAAAFGGTSCN